LFKVLLQYKILLRLVWAKHWAFCPSWYRPKH